MSFIWSYTKNNVAYAEVRSTERREKGETPKSKPMYLGKVIDIEKGIFQNRKLGIFKYDLDSGYDTAGVKDQYTRQRLKEEKAILDFGSSHMLHEYYKQIVFLDLFRDTLPKYSDSLMAMIFYYIEMSESNSEAIRWFRGSIANLLFPEARLQSQHISELLSKLGDDAVVRDFFSEYLKKYISPNNKTGVIVDSAGSPNAIHFPITAIGNQNGEISSDVKLLFAIDAKSGMPFFFRYSAGNIVDINILKHTIYELEKFGIDIKYSLLDAGYCSEENFKAMYDSGVNFLTRLPNNRKIFNEAFKTYKEEALSDLHRYVYHDGIVGIKRILASLYGNKGYVYLCVDFNKRN
ncbi:MAG: transposase, partial [Deltaproteobacteria bacterium]|nr:transposase [Deltaproteobacteria bacterium]